MNEESAVFGLMSPICSRASSILSRFFLAEGGLEVPLRIELMLPLSEWEGRTVESELDVPVEIVERGRGMNSRVSEKPTRGRDCTVAGDDSRGLSEEVSGEVGELF